MPSESHRPTRARLDRQLLIRLWESGDEGLRLGVLLEEFGKKAMRNVVVLAYQQLVEFSHVSVRGYSTMPEDPLCCSYNPWISPHPSAQRDEAARFSHPDAILRLSAFGLMSLTLASLRTGRLAAPEPIDFHVTLGDLLKGIWRAPEAIEMFERFTKSTDASERHLYVASRIKTRMLNLWRRSITGFTAAVSAHLWQAENRTSANERHKLSGLLRLLAMVEHQDPTRPDEMFWGFVDSIRVNAAALSVDLLPLAPSQTTAARSSRKRSTVSASHEGTAQRLLRDNPDLSVRELATMLQISKSSAASLAAWRRHQENLLLKRDATMQAMKAKQNRPNSRRASERHSGASDER